MPCWRPCFTGAETAQPVTWRPVAPMRPSSEISHPICPSARTRPFAPVWSATSMAVSLGRQDGCRLYEASTTALTPRWETSNKYICCVLLCYCRLLAKLLDLYHYSVQVLPVAHCKLCNSTWRLGVHNTSTSQADEPTPALPLERWHTQKSFPARSIVQVSSVQNQLESTRYCTVI